MTKIKRYKYSYYKYYAFTPAWNIRNNDHLTKNYVHENILETSTNQSWLNEGGGEGEYYESTKLSHKQTNFYDFLLECYNHNIMQPRPYFSHKFCEANVSITKRRSST